MPSDILGALSGATRLSIDFGTTHTVAVLRSTGGQASPLLFDASPLLSSAVCAEPTGTLLTGQDAQRAAPHYPGRSEPNPKLRVDEGRILLDEDEFDIEDLIAAPLRRVAAEAAHRLGGPVGNAGTVLTHPASWATPRREVLRRAAERAGLGAVRLVPEPVAAATFYAGHLHTATSGGGTP